eukprot:TRINITY_DN3257_c0_g2_i3.p1 TRINITY_DN3257_c0_g2~~TRINITY_DN3257_c0_g2_i3.p1  ORF type:complete len:414 (+),score=76.69 TRINITY_DN3257_c0_g2_i3:154-1395(+)
MNLLANPYTVSLAGLLAAGALYYLFGGLGRGPRMDYSILVGEQPTNSTKIIRNFRVPSTNKLVSDYMGHRTIYSAFQATVKADGFRNCMGYRRIIKEHTEEKVVRNQKRTRVYPELGPYKWLTYEEVDRRATFIGSALIETGLSEKKSLAVYMETRAEWTLTTQGAFTQNLVVVTVHPNLDEEALVFCLNQAECSHVVTSGGLLGGVAKCVARLNYLKVIVYCDSCKANEQDLSSLSMAGVRFYTFEEFEELGKQHVSTNPKHPPKEDDVAVLMYTSGSNGIPKGVLCTHSNCMASVGGVVKSLQLFPGDVHLSYLPLAHVFAFVVELVCLSKGVSIAYGNSRSFSDRSVRNCLGDISEARPSFLVGVPSVYHTLKAGIMEEVEKFIRPVRHVFDMAYEWKKNHLKWVPTRPF